MQRTQQSKDLVIYEGLDMKIRLEYNHTYAIIHMKDVKDFNIKSYRKLEELKNPLYDFLKTVGYEKVFAAMPRANHKIKRLAVMLGFRYIGTQDGNDIYIYGED